MPEPPRVVSLLPSATEMVCAVGGAELLVGRSHECDHPAGLAALPVLTRPREALPDSSAGIDRAVRVMLEDAISVYQVDVDGLRDTRPDVIVTQDLCEVCAVSLDDVRAALRELAREDVAICSLRPTRLQDVWNDLRRVGAALGRAEAGEAAARTCEARCGALAERLKSLPRPSVLTIEWLDPIMIGGTWMPELVELAGGRALVTGPGEHAPTLDLAALRELDPDVVVIKPCGFTLGRSAAELELLRQNLPWNSWSAVGTGRIFVADGNAFFNRPGPRLVESLEILAVALHGEACAELAHKHRSALLRVNAELELLDVVDERRVDAPG